MSQRCWFLPLLFVVFAISSCKKEPVREPVTYDFDTAVDIDSNEYQTVRIYGLPWFTENLRTTRFRNGDTLFHAKTKEQWDSLEYLPIPAYCYPNYDSSKVDTYGLMYNYWAVIDARGLAPEGWHISNREEWQVLIDRNGGPSLAGKALRSANGWQQNAGNNSTMFSAKPGGRVIFTGNMWDVGTRGYWWVNTPIGPYGGRMYVLMPDQNYLVNLVEHSTGDGGMYIRCVQDY